MAQVLEFMDRNHGSAYDKTHTDVNYIHNVD